MKKKLFLITTETSGDLLAGGLLRELNQLVPDLQVQGVGGFRARACGMNCIYSVQDFNVIGLVEVLGKLRQLKAQFNDLVAQCKTWKPDAVVLIDAPDFNIRFAKALRGTGIPIVYYVSPQVWAWRPKRAQLLANLVDQMLVLFEFEKQIYEELGLKTTWVGHSLVDEIEHFQISTKTLKTVQPKSTETLIALAPGSRKSELKRHIPIFREVVNMAAENIRFLLPLAPYLSVEHLGELAKSDKVIVLPGKMRDAISLADAAVVASGTATLETGLLGTPLVVGYRMNSLSYMLASRLVKVENIALVNIVLGKRVAPELRQDEFNAQQIWKHLKDLLPGQAGNQKMIAEFQQLSRRLGGPGSAKRAAVEVGTYL
ncbi:MAG: lipid-A-disaccharide synthase [Acidobacteria bacterium]|nr:MAG: lipid-A-disaccharide synthase [Acidobacteriota bacterium]